MLEDSDVTLRIAIGLTWLVVELKCPGRTFQEGVVALASLAGLLAAILGLT